VNKQTCEKTIEVLLKVRDECKSQLDDGALSELDQVIAELKKHRDGGLNAAEATSLGMRTLQLIALVISVVTNVKDWF
jgi:hypothetical protein